jgi:hypothetical protein
MDETDEGSSFLKARDTSLRRQLNVELKIIFQK